MNVNSCHTFCYFAPVKEVMRLMKIFLKPIIWLALICYGLFIPATELPTKPFLNIPHFDKIVHFGLFFVFCLLLFRPFRKLKVNPYFWAPAISLFLAASLEVAQQAVSSSRSSNLYDFIANTAGILASIVFFHFFVSGRKWEKFF
ncbi:MAG TPA: VanZ family protein [Tangfeifania sp.]|nr:VanZ family protein [Tangfeifania sp.]